VRLIFITGVYADAQVEQLRFIINCRHLDMEHDETRGLLKLRARPPQDCGELNAIIDEHVAHIDQRITQLHKLSKQLHKLRESCNTVSSLDGCQIMGGSDRNLCCRQQPQVAAVASRGLLTFPQSIAADETNGLNSGRFLQPRSVAHDLLSHGHERASPFVALCRPMSARLDHSIALDCDGTGARADRH